TTHEMEEPSHPEFETGADDQPIAEPAQHPEWFSQQKKPLTPYPTDQLDWVNPEGQQYPHNLLKPLPLIPNSRGRRVIPFDHFINNNLEYLCGGASRRKYTTSVTKTKAADYRHIKRLQKASHLRHRRYVAASSSRKADKSDSQRMLCFQRLSSNVYKKHCNQKACRRPSTRCQKLPEEAQPNKAGYIPDGTITDVRTALDDRLKGIRMKYLPQTIWRKSDKDRAAAMIQSIDKQLKTRRIMRSLERFVGRRLYEGDFRMLHMTI
nr:hypothetical protein [Tanacetum cinerariifolium]